MLYYFSKFEVLNLNVNIIKLMRNFLILFSTICFLFSCEKSSIKKIDVSHIDANITIDRFDVDFYKFVF